MLLDDEDPIPIEAYQDANVDRPISGLGRRDEDEDGRASSSSTAR